MYLRLNTEGVSFSQHLANYNFTRTSREFNNMEDSGKKMD